MRRAHRNRLLATAHLAPCNTPKWKKQRILSFKGLYFDLSERNQVFFPRPFQLRPALPMPQSARQPKRRASPTGRRSPAPGLWQTIPSPPTRSDPRDATVAHEVGQDPTRRRLGDPEAGLNLRSGPSAVGKRAHRRLRQRTSSLGDLHILHIPVRQHNGKRIRRHRYFRRQPLSLIAFPHPANTGPVRLDKLQAEQHVGERTVARHGDPSGEVFVFDTHRQPQAIRSPPLRA